MVLLNKRIRLISFDNHLNENSEKKILIVGGGPNGLYSALMLLQANPKALIYVVENRAAFRPQVLLIPFSVVDIMPDELKKRLWPNKRVRDSIFSPKLKSDPGFWPRTDYKCQPFIQVGEFTKVIREFLLEFYPKNFKHELLETFDPESFQFLVKYFDLAIISTGNGWFTKSLRKMMKIDHMTTDADCDKEEVDRRGVYLIYQTPDVELYERDGKEMFRCNFAPRGVTYSHANDSQNNVQIYTFPLGDLREIFTRMPKSFETTAAFRCSKPHLFLSGSDRLSDEERDWFVTYRNAIKNLLVSLQVPHPSDDEISVYFASRNEHLYDVAAGELEGIPVLFLGDSSGGTDYRLGLSLGRGLITSMNLAREMKKRTNFVFNGIVDYMNMYWKKVIASEFKKNDPVLNRKPEIVFKYYMEGRIADGKPLQMESFVKELKSIEESEAKKIPSQVEKILVSFFSSRTKTYHI